VGYALTYAPTISLSFVSDVFSSVVLDNNGYKVTINDKTFIISKYVFAEALRLPTLPDNTDVISSSQLIHMFHQMGISPFITAISQFRVKNLPYEWASVFSTLYKCLTGGVTGMDQANAAFYSILHSILYDSKVDIAEVLWTEFKNIFNKTGYNQLSCPLFWSILVEHICLKKNISFPTNDPIIHVDLKLQPPSAKRFLNLLVLYLRQ